MREGENTAQTPEIGGTEGYFKHRKFNEILRFGRKMSVHFFHSSFENCTRALMQNTQSILNGLMNII